MKVCAIAAHPGHTKELQRPTAPHVHRMGTCPRRRRRMVILCTRTDAITMGICTGTCMDTDVIATMATRLSRHLPWPTLILRWALSWQPGMPVNSCPLSGPLAVMGNACAHHLCGSDTDVTTHTTRSRQWKRVSHNTCLGLPLSSNGHSHGSQACLRTHTLCQALSPQ